MRTIPPSPPSTNRRTPKPEERQYRFLTYVFGGGVKVKDHEKYRDAVTPVRVASIRGQLRFWWRACNPSRCQTLQELRQREGVIWGSTSRASKVEIMVLAQPSAPPNVQVFEYNARRRLVPCKGMEEIAYGAFPLQPSREAQTAGEQPWVLFDYGTAKFSLGFRYPEEVRSDVEAALWAWEAFGGLGGRTRRGFGAIARIDVERALTIESELAGFKENPRIIGVPSLHQARLGTASQPSASSLDAWKEGLGLLRRMRQGRGFGRNHPPAGSLKPAGRSRWPEADEIRRLTGKSAPLHATPNVQVSAFPRAAFGMPIVFHFHPGSANEPGSQGDPKMKRLELRPEGFERFASPLVVRPIVIGTSFHASALAMTSAVPKAELVADKAVYPAQWQLDATQATRIQPLNRDGRTYLDPLDLFLAELQK